MAKPMKRPHGQARNGQLISTFGPGAMVDLPKHSVIVSGLDHWFGVRETIVENRLAAKIAAVLGVGNIRLETPPPEPEPNSNQNSGVPVFQFPEWFVSQDPEEPGTGETRTYLLVHRRKLTAGQFLDREKRKRSVTPIRFVRACRNGHIGDIDWYTFCHNGKSECREQRRQLFIDEAGTSGDISEIRVRCECGRFREMAAAAEFGNRTLGSCGGERIWLGRTMEEPCSEANRLLVRTASNAYFPQRLSVISLPEPNEKLAAAIDAVWVFLEKTQAKEELAIMRRFPNVADSLRDFTDDEVFDEITARRNVGHQAPKTVKAAELETLIAAEDERGSDVIEGNFYARNLPRARWDEPVMSGIERIVLVHRLREVAAQYGFTRFEAAGPDIEGEANLQVRRAPIADRVEWVPTIENRGEGVFLQFRREAIERWLGRPDVLNRGVALNAAFELWRKEHPGTLAVSLPYVLLHSFSHLLLTAIALECGYPSSSIRERVYAIPAIGYGVLLYTASPDAEGTLGGLVDTGRRMPHFVRQALELGRLCSNDPICAQHEPASRFEKRYLQGAACHGCQFVSETSCEMMNDYLDRALVVSTVQNLGAEFFA